MIPGQPARVASVQAALEIGERYNWTLTKENCKQRHCGHEAEPSGEG